MAIFPCDHHGSRYTGPQQTLYPAIVDGGDVERKKQRLCAPCFREASEWCESHLNDATTEDEQSGCCSCGNDEAPLWVFVTEYPAKQERQDWYGRLCKGECWTQARVALFGAGAGPVAIPATKVA